MSHPRRFAFVVIAALAVSRPVSAADEPPPFSIPQFDVSGDKQRQVVVDRQAGQYLGHPTTVLLEDGRTMIIVYPKGHGRGAIVMKRSTDGGLTWSERLPTPASWATSLEVPTLYRTVDKAGKRRLIMFSGLYPIRQAVSEDDGATWSELEPIGDYGGVVACASCLRLANGDYMALFHDDGRFLTKAGRPKGSPVKFVVYKIVSGDGGLTWGRPEPIAAHPQAHLCEPGAIRSPDGREIAVLLRENSRKFRSFVIVSDDEGKSWSEPRELPAALTGDRHTGKYLADGKLFVTFRDMLKGSPSPGDWVAWVGTYDDIVQGREGSYRLRLMDNTKGSDCAYPPVEVLPDGTLVTTTYGHWTQGEMPYIVSVRLSPADQQSFASQARAVSQTSGRRKPAGAPVDDPEAHASGSLQLEWKQLPAIDDPRGFGGQFVGVTNDRLLLYGGTNFPDAPVWAGGAKAWYRDVFVLDSPQSAWRKVGKLDDARPVGYGVSLSTKDGILCIGGADAAKHYDTVFLLNYDGDKLTTTDLPRLPRPCAYCSGAIVGGRVYVLGGIERPDATRTLRTSWSLDLRNPQAGWTELPAWPGRGRMLPLAAAHGEHVYLTGGCDLSADADGKPLRLYLNDTLRYSPAGGWEKLADAPTGIVAAPSPAAVVDHAIVVFGGDDSTSLGYKPPEKHPGFPRHVYAYDVRSDRWSRIGTAPFVPVATPIVAWQGGFVAAGGEIRPGVRSREVWMVKRKSDE